MTKIHPTQLSPDQLHWDCPIDNLPFETTQEIDPSTAVVGQETARDALLFGLQCLAPGQNIYVRGPRGAGRMRMVRQLLQELNLRTDKKRDRCYVHNFQQPDHPRLISLGPGQAEKFKKQMGRFAEFVRNDLNKALKQDPYNAERNVLKSEIESAVQKISEPLEKDLAQAGMALVSMQQGPVNQTHIFPVIDGQPVPAEQLRMLVAQEKVPAEVLENFEKQYPEFQKRLREISEKVAEQFREGTQRVEEFNERSVRELCAPLIDRIKCEFPGESVETFVTEVIDDLVEHRLTPSEEDAPMDLAELYGVNVVLCHQDAHSRPIVEENMPNIMNLMGTVETQWGAGGMAMSDYRGIRAGKLLAADQGYLILDVNELLPESGAYRALMRTLRTGCLEIVPPEINWMRPNVVVQPEPIKVKVRIILIGDARTYYHLDQFDSDFSDQFKVLADFDNEIPRNEQALLQYAGVVTNLCTEENLLPFHRTAIGRLAEHGARIVSRRQKLTARFGRIADIAREAAFLAGLESAEFVEEIHITNAIRRTKQRANLPSRKFQEMVESGTIMVQTSGDVVGQINGLAVIRSGPLTYGFPARITATIGPGRAGLINIEGRARMSGSIHTKGFHILGGLLRHLLDTEHPLAFSASLAFEQSYGGIDGDSASGAEMCCLLSALTGIPIRQSISMTGAIDQHGHIEAIGGVNEKIEGFFDACNHTGLTGDQGVIIPKSNAGDLMLRDDVVEACQNGQFAIFAVETIQEAIEILTGVPAGRKTDNGYDAGTLLAAAVERADEYWRRTLVSPDQLTTVADESELHQEPLQDPHPTDPTEIH